jgi:hypothetical protein
MDLHRRGQNPFSDRFVQHDLSCPPFLLSSVVESSVQSPVL